VARRVNSLSSEFVKVIASLMDAIIVYKWLLQSTRSYFTGCDFPGVGRRMISPCVDRRGVCNSEQHLDFHYAVMKNETGPGAATRQKLAIGVGSAKANRL